MPEKKINWKRFGFKMARKLLEVIDEEITSLTSTSWDDIASNTIKTALLALETKFLPKEE